MNFSIVLMVIKNKKHVNDLKKEDFFSKLKNDYPDDSEIERKKILLKYLIFKKVKN